MPQKPKENRIRGMFDTEPSRNEKRESIGGQGSNKKTKKDKEHEKMSQPKRSKLKLL